MEQEIKEVLVRRITDMISSLESRIRYDLKEPYYTLMEIRDLFRVNGTGTKFIENGNYKGIDKDYEFE